MSTALHSPQHLVHLYRKSIAAHNNAYSRHLGNPRKITKHYTRVVKMKNLIESRKKELKRNLKEKLINHTKHYKMAMNSKTQNNYNLHINQAGNAGKNIINIRMKLRALKKA